MKYRIVLTLAWTVFAAGCGLLHPDLPEERPPLMDMEEPVAFFPEPDDEAARLALPPGVFTGLYVRDGAQSFEEMDTDEGTGVIVTAVVENSPAMGVGLEVDDVIYEAWVGNSSEPVVLSWASQWRKLELAAEPGSPLRLIYDRAGVEKEVTLVPTPRMAPPVRTESARFREEDRVGIVLRTATEVEARSAGLAPGGGAVVVGLSKRSPWREFLQFRDLITAVDGVPVDHPNLVLEAIRRGEPGSIISVEFARDGHVTSFPGVVSERESEVTGFTIPLLFSHETDRGQSETSLLSGLLGYRETAAAWEFRLLWLIRLTGGDADRLQEVTPPEETPQ